MHTNGEPSTGPTCAEGVDVPEIETPENAEPGQPQGRRRWSEQCEDCSLKGFCQHKGRLYRVEQAVELVHPVLVNGVRCSLGKRPQGRGSHHWWLFVVLLSPSSSSLANPRIEGWFVAQIRSPHCEGRQQELLEIAASQGADEVCLQSTQVSAATPVTGAAIAASQSDGDVSAIRSKRFLRESICAFHEWVPGRLHVTRIRLVSGGPRKEVDMYIINGYTLTEDFGATKKDAY